MIKYLKNPFIIAGAVGIAYWFTKRNKGIVEEKKSIIEKVFEKKENDKKVDLDALAKEYKVPLSLVEDAQKMEIKEVAKTIISNQKMLNESKVTNDERNQVLKMIDYLEFELAKKTEEDKK